MSKRLTLCVTSPAASLLLDGAEKVFDEQGGTIGRAMGNDWVLPDPQRYLSGRHAAIYYQDGDFWLADTSANGVFVNGNSQPVGSDQPARLHDGDVLQLGDYEMLVKLAAAGPLDSPAPVLASAPGYGAAVPDPLELLRGGASTGAPPPPAVSPPAAPQPSGTRGNDLIPESLDPLELLAGSRSAGQPAAPQTPPLIVPHGAEQDHAHTLEGSFRPPPAAPPAPAAASVPAPAAPSGHEQIPEDWDIMADSGPAAPEPPAPASREPAAPAEPEFAPDPLGATQVAPIQPASPTPTAPAPSAPAPTPPASIPSAAPPAAPPPVAAAPAVPSPAPTAAAEGDVLLREFLIAAGMDPSLVPADRSTEFARLLGRLFRDLVADLREILLARAQFKRGFRMDQTMIQPKENNPLKFSAGGVDEALKTLLGERSSGYLPPEEAFHEAFQDLKDHQLAMIAGMRATLGSLLKRFDPADLEQRFEGDAGGMSFLGNKRSRYWDLFIKHHAEVLKDAEDDFQMLMGKDFARAYENQIRMLEGSRGAGPGNAAGDAGGARTAGEKRPR